jgi:hypothetical protein
MQPTQEQWGGLFEAAAKFKQLQSWKWMTNSHVFGVENPENGEVGYCCVLGNGGEMYGLAVYLGAEGLETLVGMMTGDIEEDIEFSQHCYMLSFDNRDELSPQEYKLIKQLGYKFRGAHSWPTFRLYEPGFVPWPIDQQEQVNFLTIAIEQATIVADQFKDNPDALIEGEDERFLTRVADLSSGDRVWSDQWLEPQFDDSEPLPLADPLDELHLAKVKKMVKGGAGIWEIDCFYAPVPVDEGGRPFYPMMYLIVEQATGQILQTKLCDKTRIANELTAGLLNLIEQTGAVPSEIWAVNEKVFMYTSQLLKVFGLQAFLTPELPSLQEARSSMMEFFHSGL